MSKIKFGALLVDMRGKLGGTVFSRNKGGAYSKNKVTPLNPKSSYQQAQRNALSAKAGVWRTLTPDQRRSWIDGSVNFPQVDVFGDQYFLAGNMLYNKLNLNLEKIVEHPINICPTPISVGQISVSNPAFTVGALEIDIDVVPAGFSALISATPCLSAGRYNYNSKLRNIGVLTAGSGGGTYDFVPEFIAKYGTPIVGQKIGFEIVLVSTTTGQQGVPVGIAGIVA